MKIVEQTRDNPLIASVVLFFILLFGFLLLVKFFDISYPISITTRTVSGELAVVGEGKVDVVPDTASVQAGIVVSEAATIQEAEQKINEINNKIIAALERLGIDKKDIKTSNYSINPSYDFTPNGRNNISGYTGNASLTLTIRKQELVPQVITAATEAGANQVYNSGFTVDDPSKYREEARNKAIQNAKDQARKLSKELGINLGRVVNIVESTPGPDRIVPLFAREAGVGGAPDLQPGSQTITSVVTLYFEKR
ncbi:MAG: SIMPL domain-containing protein [Candidatus Levybacteria bacterium]|nr:SIMPL domain-containing protein [Candidatus Levybacteria bacterium]